MKTYNLLHIEDSKTDADLIKRQLQKAGIADQYMLVDNETNFKKAIASFKPDIILCDHSMPNFSS
jgi:CheY-like chemotaxis protein